MNRRQLFGMLGGTALVAGELWLPGTRSIFLPPMSGWLVTPWDKIARNCDHLLISGWMFTPRDPYVLHLILGPQNPHCINLSYLPCASDSHTP